MTIKHINILLFTALLSLTFVSFSKNLLADVSSDKQFVEEFNKEKTFLEKYFPWLDLSTKKKEQIDPTKTMTSPFASKQGDLKKSGINNLYEIENRKNNKGNNNLHIANKSHSEVEQWISEAIGTSFNFSLSDMRGFKAKISPYYSDQGIGEYKNVLLRMNAMIIMKSNEKRLESYISDTPMLKKEGVSNGAYTWLYDSYVMISYVDNSERLKKSPVINRKYLVRAKISQTLDKSRHPSGLRIETLTSKKLKTEEEGT